MTDARSPLRLAAVEVPHRFGAAADALRDVDDALGGLGGDADLALLPEAAITGYVSQKGNFDLSRFAEDLDGPTARRLSALAARHRVALAGPLIERDGAARYNSLLLFDASGRRVGHWRKRHPWYPERWASPGNLGTPVIELAGWRVTACVCFDLHFIADDAPDALRDADVLLFPSAWVDDPGGDERPEKLSALARSFGLWVVNANWGRGSPAVHGQGGSSIVSPDGAVAARAGALRGVGSVVAIAR